MSGKKPLMSKLDALRLANMMNRQVSRQDQVLYVMLPKRARNCVKFPVIGWLVEEWHWSRALGRWQIIRELPIPEEIPDDLVLTPAMVEANRLLFNLKVAA